jgi:hypothetical protein
MTRENQVFVVNVVVSNSTRKMLDMNVINRLIGAALKLSIVVKICKYRGFQEGHHFISMAMEMHHTPWRDMDCFIRECARFFHDK